MERCAVAGGRGEVGDLDGDVADVASRVALLCPTEAEVGVGWAPRELQVGGGAGHGSGFGAQAGGAQRPTAPILQPRDADHGPRPRRHQLARKGRIGAHHHPQLSRPLVHPQGCGCWERQWGHRGAMGTAALPEAPPVPPRPRRCRWGLRAALRPAGVFRSAAAHALLGARPHPVRTAAVPFLFTPPLLPPHVPPPALTASAVPPPHSTVPTAVPALRGWDGGAVRGEASAQLPDGGGLGGAVPGGAQSRGYMAHGDALSGTGGWGGGGIGV